MSSASQDSSGQAVPRPQARTLLNTFTTFLTLTIHTLLYHRCLYPQETFLLAKHHNLPIPQSRHPGLCSWINDSVAQIQPLLAQGRLARVCINLHLPETLRVIERWVFDLDRFPTWIDESESANGLAKGKGKALTWEERERRERRMLRGNADEVSREEAERESGVNWLDIDEAIRGALRRIAYTAETKGALPEGSTFTLAVELKDDAPAPVGVSLAPLLISLRWRSLTGETRSTLNHGYLLSLTFSRLPQTTRPRALLLVARRQRRCAVFKLDRSSSSAG